MALTTAQRLLIKAWYATAGNLTDQQAAETLNALASPDYWVWASAVSRAKIYNTRSDIPSSWNWTTYKSQAVPEQNAWVQMFMGDETSFAQLNVRLGVAAIFTGSASAMAQRDHCFAVGRRTATMGEKLLALPVAAPPANTGNDGVPLNRGKTTNPDLLTFEGLITAQDVVDSLNTPG